MTEDYLTVAEAAAALGISERAMHNRIKAGTAAAERFGARMWMVPVAEVERLKALGRLKPGPKGPHRRADGD